MDDRRRRTPLARMLPRMPTHPYDDPREEQALRVYADAPLEDGDAVLLLDQKVCLELEQLANDWDDVSRRHLVQVLRSTAQRVLVAVARPDGALLPGDYRLWRELHVALRDSEVELLPIRALPAA